MSQRNLTSQKRGTGVFSQWNAVSLQANGRKRSLSGRKTTLNGRKHQMSGRKTTLNGRKHQVNGRKNNLNLQLKKRLYSLIWLIESLQMDMKFVLFSTT